MDQSLEQRAAAPDTQRKRTMCVLEAGRPVAAAIRDVNAHGAFLETNARPRLGDAVVLKHPVANAIAGVVSAHCRDGIMIAFHASAASTGFALAVIAAGMIAAGV